MSQKIDISIFTEDAQNWGQALNEAAWKFTEVCPEKSALLFNTCKASLREAILTYASRIVPLAELGGVEVSEAVETLRHKLANDEDGWRALCAVMGAIAYTTPRAAEAVVDDAMVERAIQGWGAHQANCRFTTLEVSLRKALEAALTPPSAKGENSHG